jgi:pimeloyl-ACP methyl ester carboxylesterase
MLLSLPTLWESTQSLVETKIIGNVCTQKPTLVFLHEGLGSVSLWRDFPAKLCNELNTAGFLYSRNGYGQSPLFTEPLGVDFMHVQAQHDLPELLRTHEITRPILIGHSDGASIALIYAALAATNDQWSQPIAAVVMAPHIFVEQVCIDAISALRKRFETDAQLQAGLNRHHRDAQKTFSTWTRAWLAEDFKQWNIQSLLPSIKCEVLAIQGEDDPFGTMAQVRGIANHHEKSTILEIAGCGHNPHAEATDQVIDAISQFLAPVLAS